MECVLQSLQPVFIVKREGEQDWKDHTDKLKCVGCTGEPGLWLGREFGILDHRCENSLRTL